MTEKQPLNFNVPGPIKATFKRMAEKYNFHQKWAVCTAAILLLAEYEDGHLDEFVGEAMAASLSEEKMELLIKRAKSGEWKKDILSRPKPFTQADRRRTGAEAMQDAMDSKQPRNKGSQGGKKA